MKLKTLLLESIVTRLVTEITTHCQPFLKEIHYNINDNILYRGIGNIPIPSILTQNDEIRTYPGHNPNRYPKDTPKVVHTELNHIFTQMFHYPFRNGTFVTGSSHIAEEYGSISITIPIGEFHYLWSPYVEDLFGNWDEFESDKLFASRTTGAPKPATEDIEDAFLNLIETNELQYQTTDLLAAIKSGHEIMIYCDKCYVLPVKEENVALALRQIQRMHTSNQ